MTLTCDLTLLKPETLGFTVPSCFNVGKGLTGLKKLKTLRIDCNQLLKIETPELSQCVQLTSLDISYNMLDSLAVSGLCFFP